MPRARASFDRGSGLDALVCCFVVGDLPFRLLAGDAIALLNTADELITLSTDALEVIVGQLAPLLAHLALGLRPIAFDLVPVHR